MSFTFKAFTWNTQRGRSISAPNSENTTDKAIRIARLAALKTLCQNHDIGFITEPGLDLRDCVSQGKPPFNDLSGTWIMNTQRDNQSDASACRPMIYAKAGALTLPSIKLNFKSGADEASRNPAVANWKNAGYTILVVSLHATSGYGGADNMQDFYDTLENLKDKWSLLLTGGDFNSENAKWGGSTMPPAPTHQSGSILDGFYATRSEQGDEQITETNVKPVQLGFSLITKNDPGVPGCYFNGQRVSDHCPVSADVEVGAYTGK